MLLGPLGRCWSRSNQMCNERTGAKLQRRMLPRHPAHTMQLLTTAVLSVKTLTEPAPSLRTMQTLLAR